MNTNPRNNDSDEDEIDLDQLRNYSVQNPEDADPLEDDDEEEEEDLEEQDSEESDEETEEDEEEEEEVEEKPKKEEKPTSKKKENKEVDEEESTAGDSLMFLVEDFQTKTGLEFSEEELETIPLDDSLDSVSKLVELASQKAVLADRKAFFSSNPDIYQAVLYKQTNGSLNGFSQEANFPDYSTLDLADVENQKLIYTEFLKLKGTDPETIKELIELAEDKNVLDKKAQASSQSVQEFYSKKKEDLTTKLQAQLAAEETERLNTVKQVTEIIKKGKILGLELGKKEQTEFMEYLSKPVDKSGKTAKDVADEALTLEQELYIQYLIKSGFKGMVNPEKPKARTLKDIKLNKLKNRTQPVGDSKKSQNLQGPDDEIDLDAIEKFVTRKN